MKIEKGIAERVHNIGLPKWIANILSPPRKIDMTKSKLYQRIAKLSNLKDGNK